MDRGNDSPQATQLKASERGGTSFKEAFSSQVPSQEAGGSLDPHQDKVGEFQQKQLENLALPVPPSAAQVKSG